MPDSPTALSSAGLPKRATQALQAIIALGLVLKLYERQWLNALIVAAILLLTASPTIFARGVKILIPPHFELLAIAFIFASLYLGERRDFYARFCWWDLALHSTSGVLLGILGFLLVYVQNANPRIDLHMRPGFVAFFAFYFSITVGALWEIFEFAMDQLFGMNMQKPMFDDPSGLTDTMWDLIVDAIGTILVAVYGYRYMRRGERSLIEQWIQRFVNTTAPHGFADARKLLRKKALRLVLAFCPPESIRASGVLPETPASPERTVRPFRIRMTIQRDETAL